MDDGLKKNDPYRGMQSGEDEIRPGFLRNNKSTEHRGTESKEAVNNLKSMENAARENIPTGLEGGLSNVRQGEEDAKGLYSGVGRARDDGKKRGRLGGILKKRGPIAAIVSAIVAVGGAMGAALLSQPQNLLAQFQEKHNSMHISAEMRSDEFFRMQMKTGRYKDPIDGKWSIYSGETFKMSNSQRTKLAAQGIKYNDNYNGARVLEFDDGTGKIQIVARDAETAKKIGNGAVDFKTIYKENPDFRNGYNKGSMTWRGAIANWFGTTTVKFLRSNKITRNMFQDFQRKVAEADAGNTKRMVTQEIIARGTEEISEGGMKVIGAEEEKIEGEDGKLKGTGKYNTKENAPEPTKSRRADFKAASAENGYSTVSSKLNDIGGKVQKGANVACTIMNTMGAISLLVTASEALQIINLTTAYFETIDKVKAGHGNDAPIHVLAEALNTNTTNTNATLVFKDGVEANSSNNNVALDTQYSKSNKTAMQASGIVALYSGGAVDPNDPSVLSFNPTAMINKVAGGIGVGMTAFEGCALTKIAANAATVVMDGLSVAACLVGLVGATVTFGATAVAGCGEAAFKALKSIGWGVAIGVTIATVISVITPTVANMLSRDLISELGGEDLGNALASGANMYLGNTHRSNGGALATAEKYKDFAIAQQQVIAENAKYERQTKDPFDITSKYTFMGSLLTQMMSFLSVHSLMNTISTTSSVLSSSIVAMSPTASAYSIEKDLPNMDEYEKTCPYLASIGAVGDAYCNPYTITDISTMEYDPGEDVIAKLAAEDSFLEEAQEVTTSDGTTISNVKINGKSDLAKYILFCNNRTSAFGIADQNIVNQVSSWGSVQTESSVFNNVVNSAIGAVPVIGDVIDVVSNEDALANAGYISGESCVAGNDADFSESPSWDKAKYYQRFIEDQSLAESMGIIEKSAVTAYLDDYYEQNPLDNSYEGMLARYSGLDKETVVALLDLIDYGNYIAGYDASERYVFGAPAVEVKEEFNLDNENIADGYYVLLGQISFSDVRNRSFAV